MAKSLGLWLFFFLDEEYRGEGAYIIFGGFFLDGSIE
jgi:hypothetical protein